MIHPISPEYDKRARANSIHDRYMEEIRAMPGDILRRVDLWWDYYRERYIETGMEGLPGSAATYHFHDVGWGLAAAAESLLGKMPWQKARECPRDALDAAAQTFGRRYKRGLEGLFCGLVEAGVSPAARERLRQHCNDFEDAFKLRLHAAYVANDKGKYPALAAEVLTMFADHVEGLLDWMVITSERNRVQELDNSLQQAAACLREVPDSYDTRRRSR